MSYLPNLLHPGTLAGPLGNVIFYSHCCSAHHHFQGIVLLSAPVDEADSGPSIPGPQVLAKGGSVTKGGNRILFAVAGD